MSGRTGNSTQYYKDGELQKTGWTVIDGNTYYLDTETGYAATGIATLVPDGATEEARCVFDAEGVFQSDVTGVYSVGAYTYSCKYFTTRFLENQQVFPRFSVVRRRNLACSET